MKTHDEMLHEWRQDPEFVREYNSLAQEFALFDELLRARQEAGLTQAEVAKLMATQPSVVARLEAGGGRRSTRLRWLHCRNTPRRLVVASKSRWCACRRSGGPPPAPSPSLNTRNSLCGRWSPRFAVVGGSRTGRAGQGVGPNPGRYSFDKVLSSSRNA